MINKLKAAIVSMDLDEFEQALEQLNAMNLQELNLEQLQEYYDIIEEASQQLAQERSKDLAKLAALNKSATYIQENIQH